MKAFHAVWVGAVPLLAASVSLAQTGNLANANESMWTGWTSGYGGIAVTILIAIVVAGLVTFVIKRNGK